MRHVCQDQRSWLAPEWATERTQDASIVASVASIDLPRSLRHELGISFRDRSALAITEGEILVLTRRRAGTRVAARYPRHGARVIEFRTLAPGGDMLVDRLVIVAGGAVVRVDFDGRLHRDGEAVVAALGGVVPAH